MKTRGKKCEERRRWERGEIDWYVVNVETEGNAFVAAQSRQIDLCVPLSGSK
jgi:hypothetical protein